MEDTLIIRRVMMPEPQLGRKEEYVPVEFVEKAKKGKIEHFFFTYGYYSDEMSFDAPGYTYNGTVPAIKGYEGIGRGIVYNGKFYFSIAIVDKPTYFSTANGHIEKIYTGFVSFDRFALHIPVKIREWDENKDPKIFQREKAYLPMPTVHNIVASRDTNKYEFTINQRNGEILDPRYAENGGAKKMGRPKTTEDIEYFKAETIFDSLKTYLREKRKKSCRITKETARSLAFVKAGEDDLYELRVKVTRERVELQWMGDDGWDTVKEYEAGSPDVYQDTLTEIADGIRRLVSACK